MATAQLGLAETDPAAVLTHLTRWAAKFHDDVSPAAVTDVLVSFAFLVGLNVAAADPVFAAALLSRTEEGMPSAAVDARTLALSLGRGLPRGDCVEARKPSEESVIGLRGMRPR